MNIVRDIILLMPNKYYLSIFISIFLPFIFVGKIFADTTAPITTNVQTPPAPDGNNGWYVSPVVFDLTATDLESGVKEINYRIDGGTWQTVSFPDSLNLVTNPSLETPGSTSTNIDAWYATVQDPSATYTRDTGTSLPGFENSSGFIGGNNYFRKTIIE